MCDKKNKIIAVLYNICQPGGGPTASPESAFDIRFTEYIDYADGEAIEFLLAGQ